MKSSHFQEIQTTRDVSGDNFSNGNIHFQFTGDSSSYFNPAKSYIKIRFRLYKREEKTDVSLSADQQIGINMFFADHLFQSQKMLLNSRCISEINDYVPQVSSLIHRLYRTEEENNNSAEWDFNHAYLSERISQVVENPVLRDSHVQGTQSAGGNVAITAATGAVVFATAQPDIDVGDIIQVTGGAEYVIIAKTSNTNMLTNAPADVGATPNWTYLKQQVKDESLYNNLNGYRDTQIFECLYKVPLAFWEIDEYIPLCQGLYNLVLTPQPSGVLERSVIENGTGVNIEPGSATDDNNNYVFEIISMNMYIMRATGAPISSKSMEINLRQVRCQSQNLTTNSLHQKTFQVHEKTKELTLAYQLAGASIENNAYSAAKFVANNNDELKLRRFWIEYDSTQLPTPIPDVQYDRANKLDYLTQRYLETQLYTNYTTSCEPYRKWLERGCTFHFSGYSDDNKADRVFVSSQFDTFSDPNVKPQVLLFDHYDCRIVLYIKDGRIQDVKIE